MFTRVLLLDDSADDVFLIERALRKLGVKKVYCISDAAEAAMFISQAGSYEHAQKPDLIITDLFMPHFDGVKLVQLVRGTYAFAQVPVVILSGGISPAQQEEAVRAGADAVFQKPCDAQKMEGC